MRQKSFRDLRGAKANKALRMDGLVLKNLEGALLWQLTLYLLRPPPGCHS